ncbi:hypothetical protein MPSEU_000087900 [Mayamaea pseudoterrestris]|nr:hypothetical protein MPSEU_000087900 [Mayamaea pseudoterrestris]
MAKQLIISAMEEVFGEYILNMSKENMKIGALKGKIELENVQLDGELIGGHIMGVLGLQGFGILSCYAKSLQISVPWKNLEKEPTKFEIRGLHLVCVPLTPATANKLYGTGSRVDPRCKLRTRVKRLTLARFERNFWNGMIPGEGPPLKRVTRAVKEVERDLRRRSRRSTSNRTPEEIEIDEVLDDLVFNSNDTAALGMNGVEDRSGRGSSTFNSEADFFNVELPRDWKVKLREKALRNMEAAIFDVHVRCETSEGDYSPQGGYNKRTASLRLAEATLSADERAFVLGITIEKFVVRTATEKWQVGSHDKRNPANGSAMSSTKGHLGPNPYLVKNNKIGSFTGVSIYWDDSPPFLLNETELLQGNYRKYSSDKVLSKTAAAMDALTHGQEPGTKIRECLGETVSTDIVSPHDYVCEGLNAEVRVRQSDRTLPGPISCSADVLPINFNFTIRPNQYVQYHKLKQSIQLQHRFDTMLHQRPTERPSVKPRSWWQYCIACVISRPNTRPWKDVQVIITNRTRYLELVAKKNRNTSDSNLGYHSGLSEKESVELLALEDLLPIEALEAFHLLALRQVYDSQRGRSTAASSQSENPSSAANREEMQSRQRQQSSSGRFRLLRSSGRSRSSAYSELGDIQPTRIPARQLEVPVVPPESAARGSLPSLSLLDTMALRLGPKPWFVDWKVHDATINIAFLGADCCTPLALLTIQAGGNISSFGRGKRDSFIEITRVDLCHSSAGKVFFLQPGDSCESQEEDWNSDESVGGDGTVASSLSGHSVNSNPGPDLSTASRFLELPPWGVVCRIAAGKDFGNSKFSVSAHPATLIWTPALFDSLLEFFPVQKSDDLQQDITQRIRNAATPLARKAQLAMLSPSLLSFHVNIAAPKVFVPIRSRTSDGSLCIDAGTFKFACIKEEGETDMNFDVTTRDIRANFLRGRNTVPSDDHNQFQYLFRLPERVGRTDSMIIYPFHITMEGRTNFMHARSEYGPRDKFPTRSGPVRNVDIVISPVSLNLVDAEVLARAFGKWYARAIHSIRSRNSQILARSSHICVPPKKIPSDNDTLPQVMMPRIVSITLDKLELALEGHSRSHAGSSDDKSMASQDSLYEVAPSTRTYLIELHDVSVRQIRQDKFSTTALSVVDAGITRLRDGLPFTPLKGRSKMTDYCILESARRGTGQHTTSESLLESGDPCILHASFVHDGRQCYDEVDVEIDSVILRVTPMTLKDCTKAARQVAEFTQLVTRELERKVHEEGRRARLRMFSNAASGSSDGLDGTPGDRAPSPALSEAIRVGIEPSAAIKVTNSAQHDSSILFRLTLKESTLLAGRPIAAIEKSSIKRDRRVAFAVLQVLGNALVMFQSIENPDASGSKTIHASVENVSSIVHTEFERVSPAEAAPMIGPLAAEFRVVYSTENFGSIVSQNISLDCGGINSCLTPNDALIMVNICTKMLERLQAFRMPPTRPGENRSSRRRSSLASLIRYQKRGTGIATRIDLDVQSVSFVLLKAYKSMYGAPEFLGFHLVDWKAKFGGCMSALSGDCSVLLSVKVFNAEVWDWDFALEPFPIHLKVEQMPNEMVLDLSSSQHIKMNFTGLLLREIAELRFDFIRDRSKGDETEGSILTPSAMSTVGLRRAIESRLVRVKNQSGVDIQVTLNATTSQFDSSIVRNGEDSALDIGKIREGEASMALQLAPSSVGLIGDREPVYNLPVTAASERVPVVLLRPRGFYDTMTQNAANIFDGFDGSKRTASPETTLTDATHGDSGLSYIAEPVVEWCMENQRLRPSIIDVYSLDKGRDLLSNSVWSPDDTIVDNPITSSSGDGSNANQEMVPRLYNTKIASKYTGTRNKSNWVKPYLNNDSPEWTDMTCTLRMAKERVMLPDSNWMWVNDWTVDLCGEVADADGWEYAADFETFTKTRRNYERGDSCRRRRWIRTRIVKPGALQRRHLKLIWETSEDEKGNYTVVVRSHVRCKNRSGTPLSIFLACPSWDQDVSIGTLQSDDEAYVPLHLSSAVYMRLARPVGSKKEPRSIHDCTCTERFCILPTSYTSSSSIRLTMELSDNVSQTKLNFVVNIISKHGVVDVIIDPVLKIINLLPCALECQLGELIGGVPRKGADARPILGKIGTHKKIALCETLSVDIGKETTCIAVTPFKKPHISLRVPGYEWSPWQRIVNRKASDNTWLPSEKEEDYHLHLKEDSELKTRVQFERVLQGGDLLNVVLSVEYGHCPTLRIYSQFWIIDKTGFGCRFSEGFADFLASAPDPETSRRSHLLTTEAKQSAIKRDLTLAGHEWSIGMSGMSLYFSRREKLTLAIETGLKERNAPKSSQKVKSKWVSPLDISNVVPKTVFSVDELNGTRQFDLCISVTVCPGIFKRTRLITLLPRYQIVNLLHRELVIAQDGCSGGALLVPSQSAIFFHWERRSLPPKVRIGAPSAQDKARGNFKHSQCWTKGCFRADRVGITSLRLPTGEGLTKIPLVVQAEVRLASKDQASAVVIVISVANEKSNPLYLLRNCTPHTILCRQPLREEPTQRQRIEDKPAEVGAHSNNHRRKASSDFNCVPTEIGPIFESLLGLRPLQDFVWTLTCGAVACFGFDDPEKPHMLEWTCVEGGDASFGGRTSFVEIDAMGSSSVLDLHDGRQILCQMKAEHSTKVVEFTEFALSQTTDSPLSRGSPSFGHKGSASPNPLVVSDSRSAASLIEDEDDPAFSVRISLPGLGISVINNGDSRSFGREIILAKLDTIYFAFSQTREGYHEFELTVLNLQADNHVQHSVHPVLLFCPRTNTGASENLLHLSAVRRLQKHSNTLVFRYAAIRLLEIEIYLDRRTAEAFARFIEPLITAKEEEMVEATYWLTKMTATIGKRFASSERDAPREIEKTVHEANTGRIYFEQLYLHPVRIGLTFTQEWMEPPNTAEHEAMMVFQFIRGMASIANAPLFFTSFVVSHVFEAPDTLTKIIAAHYSSQLTRQIFKLLGSLAILGAPADFLTNVGTGVRDFFYEPIQGAVLGPKEFIQGLDRGTQSLARGLFVGIVRGTANVTDAVNTNLAGLTADDDFIDERKTHQRMLTDAMSRGLAANRSLSDSFGLAGASIARCLRSGALGVLEQPTLYASKHGPVGFVKGLGKGLVGAILKPVVGVGDAAVLVMNHMSDATSMKQAPPKIPKRLRRALPCRSIDHPNCVRLDPYDEKAAKAQKIVTGSESVNDVYICHLNISSHLIIASEQCLWAIDRQTRDPWCVNWAEISHYATMEGGVRVVVFSQAGLKTYVFDVENKKHRAMFQSLLSMQQRKMGNSSELNSSILSAEPESLSRHQIPGIKAPQVNHIFGSCNQSRKKLDNSVKDEIDLVEQCFTRVREMSSHSSTFFRTLDEEAWCLVSSWGQVFSGLSSRRCIIASVINGTGAPIQVKSTKLMEGGSPCYSIPTKEFDAEQGILHPGGVILFFGWGTVPSLLQPGRVFMHIETNAFIGDFSDQKSPETYAESMPGYQVGFLEKSFDEFSWWAKFWLLVRAKK